MPKELDSITKLYDFLLWLIPKVDKFPKSQKFILGDKIEGILLDILGLLIEAAYSRNKGLPLKSANIKLEQLRYLIRLSKDLKLISLKNYEFSANAVDGIGVSIGGWLKYANREDPQKPVPSNNLL